MNTETHLPVYTNDELANLSLPDLMVLIIGDEDRVPRNVIEECARRGDAMTECLGRLVEDSNGWQAKTTPGEWWLRLHAVMILGLIPSEAAGLLLVKFMRRMSLEEDENLQDWLAGYWPALFQNKPESDLQALRELSEDRAADWYIRVGAIEACVAASPSLGSDALEQSLEWLAGIVANEQENWELRLCSCSTLLDFPRTQYRPLLEALAARQSGLGRHFSIDDVQMAYAATQDKGEWEKFKDPWKFYLPEAIATRQQRWAKENTESLHSIGDEDDYYDEEFFPEPYVRPALKMGRNDPCPCGSG
jgi:hypothetical protein